MTVIGAGHKIALAVAPAIALCTPLAWRYREFLRFGRIPFPVLLGAGIGLITVGLSINFLSAFAMMRAFRQGRLVTTGAYGLSRNPMYASFIFLTIPGVSLALNCWALLAASAALYAATAVFVADEERWLAGRFGGEWEQYTQQVGRIIPKVW
jgi:protein-S-isoprenylcysteine O-methyltransferase Ste14